jgi:hypothetical protein
MAEARSQQQSMQINCDEAQNILSTPQDILTKRNKLRDLSPDILYETCSIAGIDTALLPLQRSTVFPTTEAMITALLSHTGVSLISPVSEYILIHLRDLTNELVFQTLSIAGRRSRISGLNNQSNQTRTSQLITQKFVPLSCIICA